MAISKIIYKANAQDTGTVWMDATPATAAAADITAPKTAMLADGVLTTGTGSGGGGGLEYETGTYTPTNDIEKPSISFSNTHTTIPFAIVMADATGTDDTTQYTNYGFVYGSLSEIGGTKTPNDTGTNGRYDLGVYEYRKTGNPTQLALGVTYINGSSSGTYRGFWVTKTGFTPNSNNTSHYWRSGRTYKWIAVWKPTT